MIRLCLDTSAYSRYQRGDEGVARLLDRAEWVGVPAIVLGELRTGFLLGSRLEQNETDLREFLDNPVVKVLAVDEQVSRHFADIVVDLRRCGTPLPSNDIWIAATAVAASVPVLTCDGHFERIARVGSVILPS